jgi:cytoskeleton protein RodZ
MPEIGATLREARTRARIDISEIEAETKIRAKYLRALENEEWGLLPGPAYVRSFLRTYAEALDLDAKLLLEEYKLRHERPSDHDLMPIGSPRRRGGRGGPVRHREPRGVPRGVVVAVVVALLLGALWLLGNWGKKDNGTSSASTATQTSTVTRTRVPAATTTTKQQQQQAKRSASSSASSRRLIRLQVIPTGPGPVSACLVDAAGRLRIPGALLQQGTRAGPYRSKSFRLRLGNGNVRLRVDGKTYAVAKASPVAYRITKGSVKRVAPSQTPSCGQ